MRQTACELSCSWSRGVEQSIGIESSMLIAACLPACQASHVKHRMSNISCQASHVKHRMSSISCHASHQWQAQSKRKASIDELSSAWCLPACPCLPKAFLNPVTSCGLPAFEMKTLPRLQPLFLLHVWHVVSHPLLWLASLPPSHK